MQGIQRLNYGSTSCRNPWNNSCKYNIRQFAVDKEASQLNVNNSRPYNIDPNSLYGKLNHIYLIFLSSFKYIWMKHSLSIMKWQTWTSTSSSLLKYYQCPIRFFFLIIIIIIFYASHQIHLICKYNILAKESLFLDEKKHVYANTLTIKLLKNIWSTTIFNIIYFINWCDSL